MFRVEISNNDYLFKKSLVRYIRLLNIRCVGLSNKFITCNDCADILIYAVNQ